MKKEISAPLFEDMLNTTDKSIQHFGSGNPYSPKIAFIGQEAAIDMTKEKEQYDREIGYNRQQWQRVFDNSLLPVNPSKEYSPLFPYKEVNEGKGQFHKIFHKKKPNNGTSSTWYYYQKIYNLILRHGKEEKYIDLFKHSFLTDLSTISARKHSKAAKDKRLISVRERTLMFEHDFWKSIPIIILATGHMPKEVEFNIEDVFGVDYQHNALAENPKSGWCNVHYGKNRSCVLFHTHQITARYSKQRLYDIIKSEIEMYSKENALCLDITES